MTPPRSSNSLTPHVYLICYKISSRQSIVYKIFFSPYNMRVATEESAHMKSQFWRMCFLFCRYMYMYVMSQNSLKFLDCVAMSIKPQLLISTQQHSTTEYSMRGFLLCVIYYYIKLYYRYIYVNVYHVNLAVLQIDPNLLIYLDTNVLKS